MSWHERMNRAIEYIENNLCAELDLNNAAKLTYQSATAFQRTFSIITEMSVSEYIRKRRMSLAAFELQNSNTKILDIALKYGYVSPDAFTRVFKEIYGVSPSSARSKGFLLKPFPRISLFLTIKGDVMMESGADSSGPQITNMYYERMPALRLIGKRYTSADRDTDGWFDSKWNEWFRNGWFHQLFALGCLPGYENTGISCTQDGAEFAFWIGAFFPAGTAVPHGFTCTDIPAGITGISWIRGHRHNREVFSQNAREMCVNKWRETGNSVKMDFNGKIYKCRFERYDNIRFFQPDSDGKITLDHGIYLVESEISEQALAVTENARNAKINIPDTEPATFIRSPEVKISGLSSFIAHHTESNSLFSAFAALFLNMQNDSEASPYFCYIQNGICSRCGRCGEMSARSNLAKRHLKLYRYLLTVTGVGLMEIDPNENGTYDLKVLPNILPSLLEDRLDFAFQSIGLTYLSIDKDKYILMHDEADVSRQIAESIRKERPVLMKLYSGSEWHVIAGIDEKSRTLYALNTGQEKKHKRRSYTENGLFIISDWFQTMQKAIIVTGKTEKLPFGNIIRRMAKQLESAGTEKSVIPGMIDSITADNARGMAIYLKQRIDYTHNGRYHAAECFAALARETNDEASQVALLECADIYRDTHDVCRQALGVLGVGLHTDHMLPNLISQLMLDKDSQETLKKLFARIWANDRAVWRTLSLIII